jgi:hypothetical protein
MPGPQFVFTQIIPDYLVLRQTLVNMENNTITINFDEPEVLPKKLRLRISSDLESINSSSLVRGAYEFPNKTRQIVLREKGSNKSV